MTTFCDSGEQIEDFIDEFLVECPRCSKLCKVLLESTIQAREEFSLRLFRRRRAVCLNCGYSASWDGRTLKQYLDGHDWYFGLSLWLRTPCCGEVLWAFNVRHLDFLEGYVSATNRQQVPNINKSLASRLPDWIKSAKNRSEIVKCIQALRKRLPSGN